MTPLQNRLMPFLLRISAENGPKMQYFGNFSPTIAQIAVIWMHEEHMIVPEVRTELAPISHDRPKVVAAAEKCDRGGFCNSATIQFWGLATS